MIPRVFSLAIACLLSLTAQAQLPSSRASSLNNFGRYQGFGFSDGYHACEHGNCKPSKPSSFWKPWEPTARLHAKPTSPAASRLGQTSSIRISPTELQHGNGSEFEIYSQGLSTSPSYNPNTNPSTSPSFSPSTRPNFSPNTTPSTTPSTTPRANENPSQGYLLAPLTAESIPQWNSPESSEFDPSQHTHDVREAKNMVAKAFPNAKVEVIVNADGTLELRGTTDSRESAFRIVEFVRKNFLVPVKDAVSVSRN